MELSGKCALVTGATGFIGGRIAGRLATVEGMRVRALVRTPAKAARLADLGIEIAMGDITRPETLVPALEGCHLVVHAAALASDQGNAEDFYRTNVQGTANMVEAALAAGVERFIHISSAAVYGSPQQLNVDENFPLRQRGDLYGDSKAQAEEVVWQAYRERGLPVVVLRPSQVYGPGSYQFTIRPIELIKAGKMILVDGGRAYCKPVYIDSVVDGVVLAAKVDVAVGEAFNLTDGRPVPWQEFFGAYARMLGVERLPSVSYPVAWLYAALMELLAKIQGRRPSITRKAVASLRSFNSFSNEKARRVLGWQPAVDLTEGMRRIEAWLAMESGEKKVEKGREE
ncbi:MAG TPA: NAD-dependent epimerase/dehydratase family protein [Anaerolineae bacterium]|nr:NAD-dependent epimerase/dehydratase family protein [Anaerolineae bacterium]HIQ06702.1 NAD-dependent epimerase/dehydratase family protein [Anaerolineae bacterium]